MTSALLPLRRVARLVNGGTPTADPENWDGEVRWATPVDLARVDGGVVGETDRTISDTGLRTGSAAVPGSSVVLSTRAPIGYAALAGGPLAFNQGCKGLVPNSYMDARFLRYVLQADRERLDALGTGATFRELSSESLMSYSVPAPPFEEQRRIADFLDDQVAIIDELAVARRRQIELHQEVWDAELRSVLRPDGAELVPLKSVVWWQEGPGILSGNFVSDGIPILRIAHLRSEVPLEEVTYYVEADAGYKRWGHFLTTVGDLIISGSASVGALANWIEEDLAGWIPFTGLIRVGPRGPRLDRDFMRYYFLSGSFQDQVDQLKQGVGIQHWGPSHLAQVRIPLPSNAAQSWAVEKLNRFEDGTREAVAVLERTVDLLTEYKRSLVTAAVTGELDVTTARAGVAV